MSYRGRELTSGNYLKLDDISHLFNSTTTTFNLTSGGNLFYPGSSYSLLVVLGGVVQEPESAYTIDQYQITFASAPGASDDFFCIVMGVALGVGVPGEGTVSTSKLQDSSVTYEKLAPTARGVGIQSAGFSIAGAGVTQLNFIGIGNTFNYDPSTNTIDISISGNVGAGGTWNANNVGVYTGKSVGVNTTTIVGTAGSEGALQVFGNIAVTDGAVLTDQVVDGEITIPAGKNGLIIGPAAVSLGSTIIVELGSTLVIV
jgi:hypothetical protein